MGIAINSSDAKKNIGKPLAKIAILLVVSWGLFWFSEDFPVTRFFDPQSVGWVLWMSYAKDLIQPFALYFFICLGERWLKTWQSRALLAFAIPTLLEIGQGLYYQFSPSRYVGSFDPLDIVVYAIGVTVAVIMQQQVFEKMLKFW